MITTIAMSWRDLPDGREQHSSEDVPCDHRRGEQAGPGLLRPLPADHFGRRARRHDGQDEYDRDRHIPQEQIEFEPGQVDGIVNAVAGHEESYEEVELWPCLGRPSRSVPVIPDLAKCRFGVIINPIGQRGQHAEVDEHAEDSGEAVVATGVLFPPENRVVANFRPTPEPLDETGLSPVPGSDLAAHIGSIGRSQPHNRPGQQQDRCAQLQTAHPCNRIKQAARCSDAHREFHRHPERTTGHDPRVHRREPRG